MNLTKTKYETTTQPMVVKQQKGSNIMNNISKKNNTIILDLPYGLLPSGNFKGFEYMNPVTAKIGLFHSHSLTPIVLNLRGDTSSFDEIPRVFRDFILNNFTYTQTDDDGNIVTDCDWYITEFISGNYEGGTFYIGHGETTVSRISYNKIKLENEDGQVAVYNLRTGELTIK